MCAAFPGPPVALVVFSLWCVEGVGTLDMCSVGQKGEAEGCESSASNKGELCVLWHVSAHPLS